MENITYYAVLTFLFLIGGVSAAYLIFAAVSTVLGWVLPQHVIDKLTGRRG